MKHKDIIKQYVKERDEMLLKCDVGELRKFVQKWEEIHHSDIYELMMKAPDAVLEITLRKMIIHATDMPKELRVQAKEWLLSRGYSLGIMW